MKPFETPPPSGEVEGSDGILTIRGGGDPRGWNGIRYKAGLSGRNVGAKKLSMNIATIPPDGVAYAHIHVDFEVMLYILEGHVRHQFGDGLTKTLENGPGDFIFIEPGVPHEVFNMSQTEPVVAVVARSDASEWEHIVPYDTRPVRIDRVPARLMAMRRIVAMLVMLSLATFTVASAEPACVVTSPAPAAESAEHAHHQPAPPAIEHDGVRHDEGSDAGTPHCLMMSQCVSSVALGVEVRPAMNTVPVKSVPARSIQLPRSSGTAPDLPPPRA